MKHRPLFVLHALPAGFPAHRARCATHMHAAPGLSAGDQVSRADWRSFRARLVRDENLSENKSETGDIPLETARNDQEDEWAHEIAQIEPGCVLVSNPKYKWPPNFAHLNRAVVLITGINNRAVSGILLTRRTRYFVGDQASVVGRVGDEFKENILHLGGDTSMGSLEVLHAHPPSAVPGARELVPGISIGGFNASRALVQSGRADAQDFHFFIAYARWNHGQLRAEMDADAWIAAACAPSVLMGPGSGLEDPALASDSLWQKILHLLRWNVEK